MTQEEAAVLQEGLRTLSQPQLKGRKLKSPVNRNKITGQGTNQGSSARAEKIELHGQDLAVQFRDDIFKLLDSVMGYHANRNKA